MSNSDLLGGNTMDFSIQKLKYGYVNDKDPYREVKKWAFAIGTLGLGALYLWATTEVIPEGYVGIREDLRGNMILLPPGRHSNFPWESYPESPKSLSEQYIKLGPYKIVTVPTGRVAKTFDKGKLVILEEGQHLLDRASHTYAGLISSQQETEELEQITVLTADNVEIRVKADVRYRITDPSEALSHVDKPRASIREIAEMQIAQVIGHHDLSELAPAVGGVSQTLHGQASQSGTTEMFSEPEPSSVPTMTDAQTSSAPKAHGLSAVVGELLDTLGKQLRGLGIHLINIGIKSWSIANPKLQEQLAQGAVMDAKLAVAERQADITTINAKAKAGATVIEAQAEGEAAVIRAKKLKEAALEIGSDPLATQLAYLEGQSKVVGASANATLFYGMGGKAGPQFFQKAGGTNGTEVLFPTSSVARESLSAPTSPTHTA